MAPTLRTLMDAIDAGDEAAALRLLDATPQLAKAVLAEGASRQRPTAHFLPTLRRHLYAGHTALHVAAAAWRPDLMRRLIALGADPAARNRRGATPLHAAADGDPAGPRFDPAAQAAAIALLVAAGADPNAADGNGATPLHKAVRARCAAAVEALLQAGADPARLTKAGTTTARLAGVATGRGGSGSQQAKAEQAKILDLLGAPPP